ncbi:MAG TPA: FkbM family methyltransferase, partial [Flavobacteriales bacterium]|nr:FkbM family methyltransferase [Flavobacteriales bacterium]
MDGTNILNNLKQFIKTILKNLHIDPTLNMKYDRQTEKVIQKLLKPTSNTIDVGCHKGEMLEKFMKASPKGVHFAFEPIPAMFHGLTQKYAGQNCRVFPYALAEKPGQAEFNFVKNAPAYSGLKQRKYAVDKPEIEKIQVEIKTLDEVIPANVKIDFIKIDVEGAEYGVLRGGSETVKKNKPVIIFECGIGASDFYGTTPAAVHELIVHEYGLHLSTMQRWLKNEKPFAENEFIETYNQA